MKPRNKHERRLVELSNKLPIFNKEQKRWSLKHSLDHIGYRSKKYIACLDCGHIWNGPRIVLSCKCPACGTKLKIEDTRKKKLSQRRYFAVIDVSEEFQNVRHFEIYSHHKTGEAPRQFVHEVIQQFITATGEIKVVAKNWATSFGAGSFNGNLEIRNVGDHWRGLKYDIWPDKIYPKIKCLPIFIRNGYKNVDGVSPYEIFKSILSDSIAETLLKANQLGLLAARVGDKKSEVYKYWDSVKICLRNKYLIKVSDVVTWIDYIGLLEYFKKDLRNASYICPADLKGAHDKLVAKKQEIDDHKRYSVLLVGLGIDKATLQNLSAAGLKAWYDKIRYTGLLVKLGKSDESLKNRTVIDLQLEYDSIMADIKKRENKILAAKRAEEKARELERRNKQFIEDQKAYEQAKKVFFGLVFKKGDLEIKVLESIQEFIEESEAHRHCVFTNDYHKKKDSLILSAKVDGQPVETIEMCLSKMSIVQSRGRGNMASSYNEQIIGLLKKNIPAIKKRYKQSKTVAA